MARSSLAAGEGKPPRTRNLEGLLEEFERSSKVAVTHPDKKGGVE